MNINNTLFNYSLNAFSVLSHSKLQFNKRSLGPYLRCSRITRYLASAYAFHFKHVQSMKILGHWNQKCHIERKLIFGQSKQHKLHHFSGFRNFTTGKGSALQIFLHFILLFSAYSVYESSKSICSTGHLSVVNKNHYDQDLNMITALSRSGHSSIELYSVWRMKAQLEEKYLFILWHCY